MGIPKQEIQREVNKSIDNKKVFEMVVCVSKGSETETFSAGKISSNSHYFIASVSKLYTTSVILRLRDNGLINLDNRISRYFSHETMDKLHVHKGADYSDLITIRHLLSNTSGLPDYFEQKQGKDPSIKDQVIAGNDIKLNINDIISISKSMPAHFIPGTKCKAYYSDTNFQLLGQIIEKVTGHTVEQAYQKYIYAPLGLSNTYLYTDITDTKPAVFYYKNKPLWLPKIVSSFTADGGIVSTAEENMIFLKAFFSGQLFNKSNFTEMYSWNPIFYPFKYGMGLARFKFFGTFELIGHPGASGAFGYYCPKKDAYIAGTINQVSNPGLPYKLILKILKQL